MTTSSSQVIFLLNIGNRFDFDLTWTLDVKRANGPTKKRSVPRFGPLFYWTVGGVAAGFIYACAVALQTKYGTDYWFPGVVRYSCIGASIGLLIGIVRDARR